MTIIRREHAKYWKQKRTSLSSCSASYELLSNDLRSLATSDAEPETRYKPTSPTPRLSTSLTHAVIMKGTSRFSRLQKVVYI